MIVQRVDKFCHCVMYFWLSVPVNVSSTIKKWLHRGVQSLLSLKCGTLRDWCHAGTLSPQSWANVMLEGFAESAFVPSLLEYAWNDISCALVCYGTQPCQAWRRTEFRRLAFLHQICRLFRYFFFVFKGGNLWDDKMQNGSLANLSQWLICPVRKLTLSYWL